MLRRLKLFGYWTLCFVMALLLSGAIVKLGGWA
jgi:hypothetical protein